MEHLLYAKCDGVAYLTMNRQEKRNAFSPEMICRLADAWHDFRDDPDLRVAVLTGAGEVAFSAGADLGLLIPLLTRAREPEDAWDERILGEPGMLQVALLRRFELYKPVIAAVNGFALAGGTEVLQGTDIRLASTNARFGLSEAKRGIVPAGGSMVRLARQIPFCKAMEILLTGDDLSAEEACRIGLVNMVTSPAELLATAERFARRIADNGPLAIRTIKEVVLRTSGLSLEKAYSVEDAAASVVMRSSDAREGPRAFLEKRKPHFEGR